MHFALPPRKSSSPPPYNRGANGSTIVHKRRQIQYLSYIVFGILTLYLFYSWSFSAPKHRNDGSVPEDSSFLIVTLFDEATMTEDHIHMIKSNRDYFASLHGYKTFYTNVSNYHSHIEAQPSSWTLIPALRDALTRHPEIDYIWSLTPHALITNATLDLHSHVLQPLRSLMLKDIPVVPPDSVIHTFSHLTTASTNLIMSQDYDNLAHTSFILRNTLTIPQPPGRPKDTWTHYFLDAWFDPLYRQYVFQKAENHALEHIVQWHPTVLAKLAIVQQRVFNSYNFQYPKQPSKTAAIRFVDSMWEEGDLVVNFKGCEESLQRDCEKEMRGFFARWLQEVESLEGGKALDVRLKISNEQYQPKEKKARKGPTDFELKHMHY